MQVGNLLEHNYKLTYRNSDTCLYTNSFILGKEKTQLQRVNNNYNYILISSNILRALALKNANAILF